MMRMSLRGEPPEGEAEALDLVVRALDALDQGIVVLSADLGALLYKNELGRKLVPGALPLALADAIERHVTARRHGEAPPPPIRIELGERAIDVRTTASPGQPLLEIVVLKTCDPAPREIPADENRQ